ncbi:lysyl oxidase 2 3 4 [Fusarium langsethiae]|uniref:Amine oxidase n=1 Tax=Fusarium langsethiae TaxID=179993 RepID=A0A0N0V5R6_FUSLA|nr:lysyl oxidase 2 3 4 [Fusarium langsethiae]GKU07440.1 unnamed protein product [Fusarium langsethiae]
MGISKEGFLWTPSTSKHGLQTDSVVASSQHVRDKYDAVVIGAGFAGLIAARDLSKTHGVSVLLVEARDRIGGRTWTSRELGEDIEMGGTWIHWNQPHVYSELDRYRLHQRMKPTLASVSPERAFHNFGSTIENVQGDALIRAVEKTAEQVFAIDGLNSRALMPYPHDPFRQPNPWVKYDCLTIKDRLDQMNLPGYERELFESYISLFGLNAAADTGFTEVLRWYSLAGHSMAGVYELTSFYKLGNGGMTEFARTILNDTQCDRLFDTEVCEIDQSGTNVVITTKNGKTISAKAVVSTIPLNVLSDIQFSPPLSSLRSEAVRLGQPNMGAKLHFKLKDPEPVWFGTASVNDTTPYLLAFADHTGTKSSGPDGTYCVAATRSNTLNNAEDVGHVIEEFNKTFKPTSSVQAYLVHDWAKDRYAKGLWSCWAAGSMSKYLLELQKPHGKVVFANSDWANGWRGFIDGAIESGKKAARDATAIVSADATARL